MKQIVLICGPRDWTDRDVVYAALDKLLAKHETITVLHGACCTNGKPTELRGVDRFVQEWAQEREQAYLGVPARWERFGKSAEPIRNRLMLHYLPVGVVAFRHAAKDWTADISDMVEQARGAGLRVWEVEG